MSGKSTGSSKHDRNRPWCQAYRRRGQREINKCKKLYRHLRRYPDDCIAQAALDRQSILDGRAARRDLRSTGFVMAEE